MVNDVNNNLVGGWPTPLKNMTNRQLGWWHSQYDGKVIRQPCSKPPTRFGPTVSRQRTWKIDAQKLQEPLLQIKWCTFIRAKGNGPGVNAHPQSSRPLRQIRADHPGPAFSQTVFQKGKAIRYPHLLISSFTDLGQSWTKSTRFQVFDAGLKQNWFLSLPLVMTNIAMENGLFIDGLPITKWWFSMAMLVITRWYIMCNDICSSCCMNIMN